MLTSASIDAFLAHREINGASVETIRAYRTDLLGVTVPDGADWLTTELCVARYLNESRKCHSPKTIQRRLGTFRVWAKWAGKPDLLADYRAPKPATPKPHPIPEGIEGVVLMIRSSRNPRHRALCALTGLMGLRINEAISVRPSDFNMDDMTLRVLGKGDKARDVPVSGAAWGYIKNAYAQALVNDTTVTRLTNRGGRAAISRHARNAGLSHHVSSHDMRATLATAAYEKTHDLRAVQELLGHADSKTTQVYTGVSMAARRAAVEVW